MECIGNMLRLHMFCMCVFVYARIKVIHFSISFHMTYELFVSFDMNNAVWIQFNVCPFIDE